MMTERVVSKAGRLLLLLRLRDAGITDDRSLAEIGRILGVDRSTIVRDFRVLDRVEEEYRRLLATQPWIRRDLVGWLTIPQVAEATGYSEDRLGRLAREGKVLARKVDRRWYINVASVDAYIASPSPRAGGPRGPQPPRK